MDYLKKYIEIIPYFNNEKKKTSRFGITEDMVPSFTNGKKGIKLTTNPCMRFRFLKVEDHIVPLYPEREKPVREKIENVQFQGTFNLRDEIKKVKFKEIEDEEIEAVEYEVKKVEEETIEQPNIRGQYLYKYYEKKPLKWHGPMGVNYKGFQIQGNISADNKVKVIDISENKSFNPIKHVRWYMTPQIITEGDDYSLVDPLHLFEGFEWYISRETIGHYLNVIIFRGNSIKKSEINIIQAKDLHFNGLKKLINHEEYSKDLINSNLNSEIDPDLDKYITEETIIGPVLIPDYMAHQILGFICNESLCCNIILLDRPRPSFKLDNEDAVKNLDSKSKKDEQNEKNQQDKKKKKKKKKKRIDDEDNEDDNKNEDKDDDEDEDENEDEDEEEDEDESEDEDDQLKGDNNGIKSKIVKYRKKKNKQGSKSHSDSDTDSDSNSNLNSGSDSDSDSGSDSDSSDNNQKDNEFGNDDDDYYEENDYLAFKRETYMGVFESKLMDGMVKISYNTKKDEKKERKKKRKMLKKGEGNKNENSENSIEYKLSYHKSIEFEFDRFFFTIEHKYNKSIVKMIIFETENRSYEIRFRVDPEVGRDNFYYAMIAFQGCYRSQNYDWDSHLKNGNIAPIKDLIQEELELLALKGYN